MTIKTVLLTAFNVSAATELQERWNSGKRFVPSSLQQSVVDAVLDRSNNKIVGAVAGSGKTSLLMAVLHALKGKHENLDPTILNIHKISTQGGLLSASLNGGKYQVAKDKFQEILGKDNTSDLCMTFHAELLAMAKQEEKEDDYKPDVPLFWDLRSRIINLVDLVRLTFTPIADVEKILDLADLYAIDLGAYDREICLFVSNLILQSIADLLASTKPTKVDFADMLFMPVHCNKHVEKIYHSFKFDMVIVDECQDLSKIQLELIKMCSHRNTQFLFVGDPRQAIYGFAGADANSFTKIQSDLSCEYFPLSVNYRCPKEVIKIAKSYCTQIEACESSPQGFVEYVSNDDVPRLIQAGDMVLSRLTSPLIKYAIRSIKLRKAATVKGRDIGKQLCDLAKQISQMKGFKYSDFDRYADTFFNAKIRKYNDSKKAQGRIEVFEDQNEALISCYEEFIEAKSVNELCKAIDKIFDVPSASITFQTIHRAKGSEAEIVYILDFDAMPLARPDMTDDQKVQEENLTYVALTRCKFTKDNLQDSGKLYLASDTK